MASLPSPLRFRSLPTKSPLRRALVSPSARLTVTAASKEAKQREDDLRRQQRIEASARISDGAPLRPNTGLKPYQKSERMRDNPYKRNYGDQPELKKRLLEAITLDYINEGPKLWDEDLLRLVDRRWRQVYRAGADEEVDEDTIFQIRIIFAQC